MTLPVIERYTVVERIGRGGFGEVFRARRDDLDREDAIKILHAELCRDPGAVARFVGEARAASQVTHEGIVRMFGFGELPDGRAYCVMELLRGKTLRALLDERGHLPLDEAQPLLAKFAAAIDAVHAAGVAHRDLKPENLFLEPDGTVRVIDFGLAKLAASEDVTTTGRVMGSPRYMSPEQCRGNDTDARSDLYSFGAVIHHVLVGHPPFDGDALALALHHLNDPPDPPSARRPTLPPSVDAVVLGLLDKDPERRPRPLATAVAALTIAAPRQPRRWGRRALAAIVGAVAIASGFAVHEVLRAKHPASTAQRSPLRLIDRLTHAGTFPIGLARDGQSLLGEDGNGSFRIAIGAHTESRLPERWAADLPGGRHLTMTVDVADDTVSFSVADDKDQARLLVSGVQNPCLSHDGRTLSVVDHGDLELVDVPTGSKRKLRSLQPEERFSQFQFSPSERFLSSFAAGKVQITSTTDGSTRELSVPVMAEMGGGQGVALVDDNHMVYCATEGDRTSIRVRNLEPVGDAGNLIQELDPLTGDCGVSVEASRVAVQALLGRPQVGVLDLQTAKPRDLQLATPRRNTYAVAVSRDGNTLIVQDLVSRDEVDRKANTRTPFNLECQARPVPWSTGWRYIDASSDTTGSVVRLLGDGCKPIAEWNLPATSIVAGPRCRHDVCAVLTRADKLRVVTLTPGSAPHTLGEIAVGVDSDAWMLDLSPDGKRAVAAARADGSPSAPLVFSDGEAVKTIPVPGVVQGVVWANETERFVISGMNIDGHPYALIAVGLDGTRELLWSAPSTWFLVTDRSEDGNELFGVMNRMSSEVLVFERVPGVPLD